MSPEKAIPPAKKVSGLLTVLSFVLSLPILASVIWLFYMKEYDCEGILRLPRYQIGVGVGLIFMFVLSNMGLLLRGKFPMPALIVVMVPLIVMMTMGLGLMGAYEMESESIPASPKWFQLKVADDNTWNNIKACIFDTGVCDAVMERAKQVKSYDFVMQRFPSMESGCCKPPARCAMENVNGSMWEKKGGEPGDGDKDCQLWNNDRNMLCYECESCRRGFSSTLISKWWKLGLFLALISFFLILSHLFLFLVTMWLRYSA